MNTLQKFNYQQEFVLESGNKLPHLEIGFHTYGKLNKNKDNEQIQRQYRNASVASFKTYPTPDYNPQTGKWDYRTKEAKMAAMRAVAGGE